MTFCLTLFAWFLFFVVVVVLLFVCCLLLLLFFGGAHSWNQLLGLNNQEQHSKVVRYSPDSLVSVLFFNTYMPKSLGSLCVAIKIMQEILRVSKKGGLNVNTLNPSVGPTDTCVHQLEVMKRARLLCCQTGRGGADTCREKVSQLGAVCTRRNDRICHSCPEEVIMSPCCRTRGALSLSEYGGRCEDIRSTCEVRFTVADATNRK